MPRTPYYIVSGLTVNGGATNVVERDQIIHNIQAEVVQLHNTNGLERTAYDEFEYVKTGDIFIERDVIPLGKGINPWNFKAQRSVHTVQLYGLNNSLRKFTVTRYHGRDASAMWQDDFTKLSRIRSAQTMQLFGINRSNVPALIFYDALVPISNMYHVGLFWRSMCINFLKTTLSCLCNEMWIDSKKGRIKAGLAESLDLHLVLSSDEVQIPPTVEMLNEDIFVRYLLQHGGSDYGVVEAVMCSSDWEYGFPEDFVEEELRFDTIYSGSGSPFARFPSGFIASQSAEVCPQIYACDSDPFTTEEKSMGNGYVRFTLKPPSLRTQHDCQNIKIIWNVSLYEGERTMAWLAQAPRLQRALRIHPTESSVQEQYILCPKISLQGSLKEPQSRFLSQEYESRSVYLFVSCLPLEHIEDLSDISPQLDDYWSFDSTVESKIPEYLQELLGLPELELEVDVRFGSLCVHDAIRTWQVARGYDPDTADFAEELEYPELKLVGEAAVPFEEL